MASKKAKIYRSSSSQETEKLGEGIACAIRPSRGAAVVALEGDLGAGKTTFVQGFMRGLGAKGRSPSPTFIIMRRKALKHSRFKNVFHIDAYRLKEPAQLAALGVKEIMEDPANLLLIEWADRVKKILPKKITKIKFRHGKNENERILLFALPSHL